MAGIRALMVVSDEKRRMSLLDLRNTDAKTVVRIELDEPVSAGARDPAVSPCSRSAAMTARRAAGPSAS